jgi:PPOX class probable F420-dependent enzyme
MALADEKYILFTTFRKNGEPVATPVWQADVGNGEIGFYTGAESGKAKRLRHTPRVTIQACDQRGKQVHGEVHEATARLVTGDQAESVHAAIRAKYGLVVTLMGVVMPIILRLRGKGSAYGDSAVIITLGDSSA